MESIIEKIMDEKKFRGLDRNKLENEIDQIQKGLAMNLKRHIVPVDGVNFMSYGTKVLNKYTNQKGPGDYRLLVNNGTVEALAVHGKRGYEIICRI